MAEMTWREKRQMKKRTKGLLAPSDNRRVIRDRNGWGNSVKRWTKHRTGEVSTTEIYGWLSPLPQPGWLFMDTDGPHLITDVRPCGDPPDMFFATTEPLSAEDGRRLLAEAAARTPSWTDGLV